MNLVLLYLLILSYTKYFLFCLTQNIFSISNIFTIYIRKHYSSSRYFCRWKMYFSMYLLVLFHISIVLNENINNKTKIGKMNFEIDPTNDQYRFLTVKYLFSWAIENERYDTTNFCLNWQRFLTTHVIVHMVVKTSTWKSYIPIPN